MVDPQRFETGAKTKRGKEVSKMNALKMSKELHILMKDIKSLITKQKNTQFYK